MLFALVVSVAFAISPSPDPSAPAPVTKRATPATQKRAQLDAKRFEAYVAGGGGTRLIDTNGGFGGGLQLGLGVRTVRGLFVEAELGEGLYSGAPARTIGTIHAGLRYEFRKRPRIRPSVRLLLAHSHESTLDAFADRPGATLLGTARTVKHRTGVLAGTGVVIPFPTHWRGALPNFATIVRLDGAYYFDDAPGALQIGLGVGLQAVF